MAVMRRTGWAGILIVVALASVACAASISAKKGHVGGPPTLKLGHEDEGKKTTRPVVIGRGRTYDGHAEIVAYGWQPPPDGADGNKHFCVWVEYPPDDIQFGTCAETGQPSSEIEISSELQGLGPKSARYTEVGGLMRSDVASVRVTYHRKRGRKRAKTTIAKVTAPLQSKLNLTEGFGYWDTKVHGLVPLKPFKAKAFDSQGKLLGTATHLTGQTTFVP